jgi:hypothetical protein
MLLANEDPAKVGRASKANSLAYQPALEKIAGFDINWNIVAYPNPSWAKQVFPGDEEEVAVRKLAEAIFSASRVDVADPVAAWAEHNAALRSRTEWLNARNFHALRFTGPGTDLTVGLADGHEWHGGASTAKNGITCNPNIPTEEVFTTPHALRVDGHVSSTKPLSHQGTLIDQIEVRFEGGRIVEAKAARGEEVLLKVLEERAVVLQHAVRRERGEPHRARPVLFEVLRRRRLDDARAGRGAGRQQELHPHRLDDRLRQDRCRRRRRRRHGDAGDAQGRMGLRPVACRNGQRPANSFS